MILPNKQFSNQIHLLHNYFKIRIPHYKLNQNKINKMMLEKMLYKIYRLIKLIKMKMMKEF